MSVGIARVDDGEVDGGWRCQVPVRAGLLTSRLLTAMVSIDKGPEGLALSLSPISLTLPPSLSIVVGRFRGAGPNLRVVARAMVSRPLATSL